MSWDAEKEEREEGKEEGRGGRKEEEGREGRRKRELTRLLQEKTSAESKGGGEMAQYEAREVGRQGLDSRISVLILETMKSC